MLRIKIELDQFGSGNIITFWMMDVWNDLSGTKFLGNYKFRIYNKNSTNILWKRGEIKGFRRLKWSPWYLLYLCLKQIYDE